MLYALLKFLHLCSVVVWVGGMFFTLFCLRPAAMGLPPPVRVPFMKDVLGRFFALVLWAAVIAVGSGSAMVMRAAQLTRETGAPFRMTLDWMVMAVLGLLMVAIYGHIRLVLYRRLGRAVDAQDWPTGGAALNGIRRWVAVNLALGVAIFAVVLMGALS